MRRPSRFSQALAAGALLSVWSAPALADGYVTAGTEGWYQSAPEAKYQEFREVPRGIFVESFLYRDRFWKGNLSVWGANAIRSDQEIGGVYRRPRWHLDLNYQETPHNISFISRTGYTLLEPDVQRLPDSLQAQNQANPSGYTTRMSDFLNQAHKIPLGIQTNVLTSRLGGRPGNGLSFELKGSRRSRSGGKPYGGTFGFSNAVEVIEPIRQTMAEGQGLLGYTKKRVTIEGNVDYSAFENDHSTLIWDNPRALTDVVGTPGHGALDLYPDNQSWRAGGKVSIQLPHRSVLTAAGSYGQATQNDKWLPYTTNTAPAIVDSINANPLPGTSTDAKANLINLDARLTSHPLSRVGGTLRYHQHKYENKTKEWTLSGQVPYDGTWNGTDVTADPVGNVQKVYGADLDWNPVSRIGLYGTAEHIDRIHTFREVPEDHEDAFEGRVRVRPRTALQIDGRYRHGERWFDEFDFEDYQNAVGQFVEQPELRRFDVSPRVQNLADGTISWTGNERLTLSGTVGYLRNEYHAHLGLLDELRRSASIGATIEMTDRIDLSGTFGWSRIYTNQRSRESGATMSLSDSTAWQARLTDNIYAADADVTWRVVPDRFALITSYFYDRGPGIFDLSNAAGTAQDLPSTDYKRQGVGVEARYTVQENTELAARWMWEQYDVTDFSSEDIPLLFPTTGASNAIFLGDSALDYRANAVALVVKRSW